MQRKKYKVTLYMNYRIKEICDEKGIKVNSIAEKVSITLPALYNIVNGKMSPKVETLEKIATALNVPVWQLFASPEEVTGEGELTSLIQYEKNFYKATTVKEIIDAIRKIKIEQKCNKEEWIPQIGERYWYVSVPHSWDFEYTHPIEGIREDNGTEIFNGNNFFKTENEAIEITNEIRLLFGYPQYKK